MGAITSTGTVPTTDEGVDAANPAASLEKKTVSDLKIVSGTGDDQQIGFETIDEKEERALVWRLDLGFLLIGFLGYMFKYLDQVNISNAYVSGMQEELSLYGNELNYFTTYFK